MSHEYAMSTSCFRTEWACRLIATELYVSHYMFSRKRKLSIMMYFAISLYFRIGLMPLWVEIGIGQCYSIIRINDGHDGRLMEIETILKSHLHYWHVDSIVPNDSVSLCVSVRLSMSVCILSFSDNFLQNINQCFSPFAPNHHLSNFIIISANNIFLTIVVSILEYCRKTNNQIIF